MIGVHFKVTAHAALLLGSYLTPKKQLDQAQAVYTCEHKVAFAVPAIDSLRSIDWCRVPVSPGTNQRKRHGCIPEDAG